MICDGGGGRVTFRAVRSEGTGREDGLERAVRREGSFRGRLAGRASSSSLPGAPLIDGSVGLLLRLATRFAFALNEK